MRIDLTLEKETTESLYKWAADILTVASPRVLKSIIAVLIFIQNQNESSNCNSNTAVKRLIKAENDPSVPLDDLEYLKSWDILRVDRSIHIPGTIKYVFEGIEQYKCLIGLLLSDPSLIQFLQTIHKITTQKLKDNNDFRILRTVVIRGRLAIVSMQDKNLSEVLPANEMLEIHSQRYKSDLVQLGLITSEGCLTQESYNFAYTYTRILKSLKLGYVPHLGKSLSQSDLLRLKGCVDQLIGQEN